MAASQIPELWAAAQDKVLPYLPYAFSHVHMIASALLPIYAGSHASLTRPASAAKSRRRKRRHDGPDPDDNTHKMEGLTPSDAIIYPLLTGLLLTGLYYLIKWLEDPDILNKIMNWYLSSFGVFAVTRFLTDICNLIQSFILPTQYGFLGKVWSIRMAKRQFCAEDTGGKGQGREISDTALPPSFWLLQILRSQRRLVWRVRESLAKPMYILDTYLHEMFEASIAVGPTLQFNAIVSVIAILYFNLIDKPWWLTNLMGFSYSYGVLQLMSPTTFATGTLILIALFFYDIYFVFFTPMMITVATKLDMPVKLLIPRPADGAEPLKQALSMLGLGDIVLPGIMIGLALRFDLHMFYLKRQVRRSATETQDPLSPEEKQESSIAPGSGETIVYDKSGVGRVEYRRATGDWGERFWLGSKLAEQVSGGCFPKTYFHAGLIGYVTGLIITLIVLKIFQHGQPALLYLVPGVLMSLWGTAFFRGELKEMWEYSEFEDAKASKDKTKGTKQDAKKDSASKADRALANKDEVQNDDSNPNTNESPSMALSDADSLSLRSYEELPIIRSKHAVFSLSVRLPSPLSAGEATSTTKKKA